ncbi:hypothetical protein K503DRAFT_788317, partial [Rhizopogon vinicolor AM-OR11-026]
DKGDESWLRMTCFVKKEMRIYDTLKSPTSTIVQARVIIDDRVNIEIDDVVVELCISNFVSSIPENSLSTKRGAVTSKVPRRVLPAVSAEIVGTMDMTMTESFTFLTNEVVVLPRRVDLRGVSLFAGIVGKVSSTLQAGDGMMSGGGDGVGGTGMNCSTGSIGSESAARLEIVEMDEVGSVVDSLPHMVEGDTGCRFLRIAEEYFDQMVSVWCSKVRGTVDSDEIEDSIVLFLGEVGVE